VPSSQIGAGQGWVAKPVDGAGSEDVQIFSERDRLEEFQQSDDWRTERYVAGKSVSVSIIKIHGECFFLPPAGQIFADGTVADGAVIGHYVGTEFPLEEDFTRRAETLAKQTVAILPEFSGYIGIDMILADTGSDVVIEINPRMTMSYCHLPLELRSRWLKATAT